MQHLNKIAFGILLFLIEWVIYSNIFGHLLYLFNLDKPYVYWLILGAGTIAYILVEFFWLKTKEINEFIDKAK